MACNKRRNETDRLARCFLYLFSNFVNWIVRLSSSFSLPRKHARKRSLVPPPVKAGENNKNRPVGFDKNHKGRTTPIHTPSHTTPMPAPPPHPKSAPWSWNKYNGPPRSPSPALPHMSQTSRFKPGTAPPPRFSGAVHYGSPRPRPHASIPPPPPYARVQQRQVTSRDTSDSTVPTKGDLITCPNNTP